MKHPATYIALLALFVALGGPAEARKLINGKLLKRGTVTGAAIKDHSLSTRDLSNAAVRSLMATRVGSIRTDQIAFGAVTAAKLGPNSVAGDKLADSSVNGAKVADESLTSADLAAGSVGNSELATSAVGKAKIGSNAVGTSELQDDSVTATEIADGSVDAGAVIDGSLTGKDVGVFSGTVTPTTLASLTPGHCAGVDVSLTPIAGQDVTDDAIVVTPPGTWPDGLTVTARGTAPTLIRMTVCDIDAGIAAVDPNGTFRYLSFG